MHDQEKTLLPQSQSPFANSRSAREKLPRHPTTSIPVNFIDDGREHFAYLPGEINATKSSRGWESSQQSFQFLVVTDRLEEPKPGEVRVDNQFGRDWKPYRSLRRIKPGDVLDYRQPEGEEARLLVVSGPHKCGDRREPPAFRARLWSKKAWSISIYRFELKRVLKVVGRQEVGWRIS